MLVNVSVNRLNSGKVQICVAKPHYNPNPVQDYPSANEARDALLKFGVSEEVIDSSLGVLPDLGPKENWSLPAMDVPKEVLWAQGFRV